MENPDVAALLAHDIETNIAVLQLGGMVATLALALVGVVLSMRAYAVLSEARALYWQASKLTAIAGTEASSRAARAAAINASRTKRKLKSNRLRGMM